MSNDPEFAPDLYRGVAALYDRYRLPYASQLITALLEETAPSGTGRALDLGCGPGQLAFARHQVTERHDWTTSALAGFVFATSFLPITILGDRAAEFQADLAERLQPYVQNGRLPDNVSYAYALFARPILS